MAETGDPSGGVAMQRRRCAACGARFRPRPQIREQRFCSLPDCQRERRRRWKRRKQRTDPDYRDNQARAQRAWCERHRGYCRQYRRRHPQYRERDARCAHLDRGSAGLFAAASEPKDFWEVPGTAHVNLHHFAKAEYERRMGAFLAQYLRPEHASRRPVNLRTSDCRGIRDGANPPALGRRIHAKLN